MNHGESSRLKWGYPKIPTVADFTWFCIRRASTGETYLELRVEQVVQALKRIGIFSTDPKVLSDGGNLIVHLSPYPVVARVMTLFGEDHSLCWRNILAREMDVARHLNGAGVPVVSPTHHYDPGPHPVGDTWCTLWEYIPHADLPPLNGDEAFHLLQSLEYGMKTYPDDLPRLGAWIPVCDAMRQLSTIGNEQIREFIEYWTIMDKCLRSISADQLVPVHGDAHLGNLIASPKGWLWIDFEDVSLMPRFWDLASAVARTPLLGEAKELSDTLIRHYLGDTPDPDDTRAFTLALSARLIASISFNMWLAVKGHSNSDRALRRLRNGLHILDSIFSGNSSYVKKERGAMMKVTGFNHVTIRVRDLQRSLAFYRDVLGMKVVHLGRTDAYLDWGGAWVCLIEKANSTPASESAPGVDHVAFSISESDFDEAVQQLKQQGVTIVRGPVRRGQGWTVNFLDPDGTQLELHTSNLAERMEVWT